MEAGAGAWIGETDALTILRLVSDAWDERVVLRSLIAEHGYTQYVRRLDKAGHQIGGRHVARPEVAMLRELEKLLSVWLGQLGLNPSDRGRLGLDQVRTKATGLVAIRAERAQKAGRPRD